MKKPLKIVFSKIMKRFGEIHGKLMTENPQNNAILPTQYYLNLEVFVCVNIYFKILGHKYTQISNDSPWVLQTVSLNLLFFILITFTVKITLLL